VVLHSEHQAQCWEDIEVQGSEVLCDPVLADLQQAMSPIHPLRLHCPQTIGLLAQHNVNDKTVTFAKMVLRRIRRPSVRKSIFKSITSPVLGFVYGGMIIGFVVNVLSSLVLNISPLSTQQTLFIWLLAVCIPLFPVAVYAWSWIAYLRKRLADANA